MAVGNGKWEVASGCVGAGVWDRVQEMAGMWEVDLRWREQLSELLLEVAGRFGDGVRVVGANLRTLDLLAVLDDQRR